MGTVLGNGQGAGETEAGGAPCRRRSDLTGLLTGVSALAAVGRARWRENTDGGHQEGAPGTSPPPKASRAQPGPPRNFLPANTGDVLRNHLPL